MIQILSGLQPGEQVIVSGQYGLPDKTKVKATPASAGPGKKSEGVKGPWRRLHSNGPDMIADEGSRSGRRTRRASSGGDDRFLNQTEATPA